MEQIRAHGRAMVASVFVLIIVVLAAIGVAASESGPAVEADDPEHLANFRLAPNQPQQEAELRELQPQRALNVPDVVYPGPDLRPVQFGPYQLVPEGWVGPLVEAREITNPPPLPTNEAPITDIPTLQSSELWRSPAGVPPGYEFIGAASAEVDFDVSLTYRMPTLDATPGYLGEIRVVVWRPPVRPINVTMIGPADAYTTTRIDNRPAVIWEGREPNGEIYGVSVRAFDEPSGIEYGIEAVGIQTDVAIEILRSLYE